MPIRTVPGPRQYSLRTELLAVLAGILLTNSHSAPSATLGDVRFTDYSNLASNEELVRRLLSPLQAQQLQREGRTMTAQPFDLATERFVVYLPSQHPAQGFALIVFVPPWQDALVPEGWKAVLDHYGAIFVSAARSGNIEPISRRELLAILATENLMHRYPVDPDRVYIAGFSGGARIALRLGLAYPDLFRGAVLNAGSHPIGTPTLPLPPKELFYRFQESSKVVYLTGRRDEVNTLGDQRSISSLHHWCVFGDYDYIVPFSEHEVAPASALSQALAALAAKPEVNPARLAACRATIDAQLAEQLSAADSLIARGRRDEALKVRQAIDGQFGGLAALRAPDAEAR